MSERPIRRRGPLTILRESHTARRWLLAAIVAGSVYSLSIGPAARLSREFGDPRWLTATLGVIYSPLVFFSEHSPREAGQVLEWYIVFCRGRRTIDYDILVPPGEMPPDVD